MQGKFYIFKTPRARCVPWDRGTTSVHRRSTCTPSSTRRIRARCSTGTTTGARSPHHRWPPHADHYQQPPTATSREEEEEEGEDGRGRKGERRREGEEGGGEIGWGEGRRKDARRLEARAPGEEGERARAGEGEEESPHAWGR